MNRSDILDTAKGYVTRDRAATHGDAEDQFKTIGKLWAALDGREYTPAQVALMMAGLKLVRAWGNPHHADNWIDLAGYAACGGEIATSPEAILTQLQREAEAAGLYDVEKPQSPLPLLWTKGEPQAVVVRDIAADAPAAPRSAPENGINAPEGGGVAETAKGHLAGRESGGEA